MTAKVLTPVDPHPGLWRTRGNCTKVDPDTMFPETIAQERRVVRDVCRSPQVCPVKAQCLEDALTQDHQYGVAGGLTSGQRRRLQANMTIPAGRLGVRA